MSIATLTTKGQVTIPKDVRERLGLRAGDRLEFVVEGDGAVRMRRRTTDLLSLVGTLKSDRRVTVEQMNETIARVGARRGAGR